MSVTFTSTSKDVRSLIWTTATPPTTELARLEATASANAVTFVVPKEEVLTLNTILDETVEDNGGKEGGKEGGGLEGGGWAGGGLRGGGWAGGSGQGGCGGVSGGVSGGGGEGKGDI